MIIRECLISIMKGKFLEQVDLDISFDPEDISALSPN